MMGRPSRRGTTLTMGVGLAALFVGLNLWASPINVVHPSDAPETEIGKQEREKIELSQELPSALPEEPSAASPSPELFLQRLNRLLPEDNQTLLTIDQINDIQEELFQFQIPRNVTVRFMDADYVSIQYYRWLFNDQTAPVSGRRRCANCYLRFDPDPLKWEPNHGHDFVRNNEEAVKGVADVHVDLNCPSSVRMHFREAPWQVSLGGCGESQAGTGGSYAHHGRKQFDYAVGFEKVHDGVFQTTYAHLHLSPDNKFGMPELWNVTDMAKLLLRNEHPNPQQVEPAMFVHNNCGDKRGSVLAEMTTLEPPVTVARYKCLENREKPNITNVFESMDNVPCSNRPKEARFHGTCWEPVRDGGKTILSSMHQFTFSLENTLSQDYVTEKRWQSLLGNSVPIVWDNHNSRDSLPDTSAALLLDPAESDGNLARYLQDRLLYYQTNRTAFETDFFAWKQTGHLRASFVRKLFLSNDYLVCRICEYVAHNHKRSGTVAGHGGSSYVHS